MNVAAVLICPLRLIHVWFVRFPGVQIDGKKLEIFAQLLSAPMELPSHLI
jgi:hypothetical protein